MPEQMAKAVRRCAATDEVIDLAYETFGDAANPAFVLIMGLNGQLTFWEDELCLALAKRFFVIRFDNRDVGYSTKLEGKKCPSVVSHALPGWLNWFPTPAPYSLDDMALDLWALVDAVVSPGAPAHLLGMSMGGMIAQCAALLKPERCLSLVSVMSTTGAPDLPDASFWVKTQFLKKPKSDAMEDELAFRVQMLRDVFAKDVEMDAAASEKLYRRCLDRTRYVGGFPRHLAAIRRAPSRDEAWRALGARAPPTLVVHGRNDILVPPAHGERTAEVIHGAKLVILDNMGHNVVGGSIRERFLAEVLAFTAGGA